LYRIVAYTDLDSSFTVFPLFLAGSQKCDSDSFIEQISDVLKKYIRQNPDVWTPILSQVKYYLYAPILFLGI